MINAPPMFDRFSRRCRRLPGAAAVAAVTDAATHRLLLLVLLLALIFLAALPPCAGMNDADGTVAATDGPQINDEEDHDSSSSSSFSSSSSNPLLIGNGEYEDGSNVARDDPCKGIDSVDDCRCGKQPCQYCLKCPCYGCISSFRNANREKDILAGGVDMRDPEALQQGRENPGDGSPLPVLEKICADLSGRDGKRACCALQKCGYNKQDWSCVPAAEFKSQSHNVCHSLRLAAAEQGALLRLRR